MSETQACPITDLKTILLATDGSVYSEKALHEAVNLSKACGTKLIVMSVVEANPEFSSLAPQLVEQKEKEAREFLEAAKNCAVKENVNCETVVHEGEDVAHFIVEEAVRLKADMIVMGKLGKKKGLKKLLMGSVTSKVISHAPCKVLVVPA